ncbi:MAG: hypothetical protein H6948_12370 [Zoogloeaceae bacterium]|nr:hypothetical protein [Zoogloeaceae bacterium]
MIESRYQRECLGKGRTNPADRQSAASPLHREVEPPEQRSTIGNVALTELIHRIQYRYDEQPDASRRRFGQGDVEHDIAFADPEDVFGGMFETARMRQPKCPHELCARRADFSLETHRRCLAARLH